MSEIIIKNDGHSVNIEDLTKVALQLVINAFWDGLSWDMKLKAENLYSSNDIAMNWYSCWRELAFASFPHELVQTDKFKSAIELYDLAYDQYVTFEQFESSKGLSS